MPESSKWSLPFGYTNQICLRISRFPLACYMPFHLTFLHLSKVSKFYLKHFLILDTYI